MPEKSLTGKSIKNSYEGLLHLNNDGLAADGLTTRKPVYDGVGNTTCLEIASNSLKVNGDVNITSGSSSVYIRSGSGAIELADGASGDNPYIDFKTSGSEDYDCRIIKSSNGLDFYTGGNSNKQYAARFTSGADLQVYGTVRIGKKSSDGVDTSPTQPFADLTATRINKIDRLYVYGNDYVHVVGSENNTRKTIATFHKTGLALGRGTATPNKTLDVVGTLRLKISGTEAAGKVLTCTNSSGDTEWADAPGSDSTPYRATHNIGQTYRNQSGGKIMVLATIRSTNDIYGFAIYAGPVKSEVQAVCGRVASIDPPYIPNQADSSDIGSVRRLAFSHQVSDNSANDAATITAIIPDNYYYKIAINAGNSVNATQIGSRTYYYDTTEAWRI